MIVRRDFLVGTGALALTASTLAVPSVSPAGRGLGIADRIAAIPSPITTQQLSTALASALNNIGLGGGLPDAIRNVSAEDIGFRLLPETLSPLRARDDVFVAMCNLIADERLSTAFRYVLFDYARSTASSPQRRTILSIHSRNIAMARTAAPIIRVKAIRYLCRDTSSQSIATLQHIVDTSESPELVGAASFVAAQWYRRDIAGASNIMASVVYRANQAPSEVIKSPSWLRALAASATLSHAALDGVVAAARSADERAAIIQAIGPTLSSEHYARLVSNMNNPLTPPERKSLIASVNTSTALRDLISLGHTETALTIAAAMPQSMLAGDAALINILSELSTRNDSRIAITARTLLQRQIPYVAPRDISSHPARSTSALKRSTAAGNGSTGVALPPQGPWPTPHPPTPHTPYPTPSPTKTPSTSPTPVAWNAQQTARLSKSAFPSGMHKGDALYRELSRSITAVGVAEHWHSGIFLGLSVDGEGYEMEGIHATDLTILYFSSYSEPARWGTDKYKVRVPWNSNDPELYVGSLMLALKQGLVRAFAGNAPLPFHGARRPPSGIGGLKRQRIASTAQQFFGKDIGYCFKDQLQYIDDVWDGTINDIDGTRCDGVVEYSFEKNGIEVCGGVNSSRWNIAAPGTANVDNHEEFHTWNYVHGEICPRIQAGDEGDPAHRGARNGTKMAFEMEGGPRLLGVRTTGDSPLYGPYITFRLETSAYSTARVRITVSKDGGRKHFIRTEDPYGLAKDGALLGDWQHLEAPANLPDAGESIAFWTGKTTDGIDFSGQDGIYEFRVVAFDVGGNVSTEWLTQQPISWRWMTFKFEPPILRPEVYSQDRKKVTLSWTPVARATSYTVDISAVYISIRGKIQDVTTQPLYHTTTTQTSITVPGDRRLRRWRVTAKNDTRSAASQWEALYP